MDGIFEETSRLGLLDPIASAELGQDVVYAVQTGRDLIDAAECDCLDLGDYTTDDDLHGSAAMLSYAAALSIIIVALAAAASLLILASGWTL